jgi:ribosomal-protein-alanine N-acetyltransferase
VALEIRVVTPEWQQPLADFFTAIRLSGDRYFHPHPFTYEFAEMLAHYGGKDLYYLLVNGNRVMAYGMLRGWDQGYAVPSLGIAVHPEDRGTQLGELLVRFLHGAARQRGAQRIRLKVYLDHTSAKRLYTKLGYTFDSVEEDGQLVGTFII